MMAMLRCRIWRLTLSTSLAGLLVLLVYHTSVDSTVQIVLGDVEDCRPSLEINDTDEAFLRRCRFPVVSFNSTVDERIDDLKKVQLPFLKNYRNPCWYEELPQTDDRIYRVNKQMFRDQAKRSYAIMKPVLDSRRASGDLWRLRCLPLVYVIGVAKCGTTDLWGVLTSHPHVVRGATKEPMFWNHNRWVHKSRLSDFVDLFDEAAEKIRKHAVDVQQGNQSYLHHPKITVDMSVETLFSFKGTYLCFHDNDEDTGPRHTSPLMIRNLTPGAKIILMVRNPIDRLYSEYVFFNRDKPTSQTDFHELCREAVERMSDCLSKKSARSCVYDPRYTNSNKWVRLVAGMYAPFVKDWLRVFPHVKVYRTEDYHTDRVAVYTDILQYIGLDHIIPDAVKSEAINNQGPPKSPMLTKTRRLLYDFYQPFNRELAALLNDTRFNFQDS